MSSYSLWELNMQELIQDFTGDELTIATAEVFLKGIGFNAIEISSLPTSAERMLLVHANTDYAFASDDLSWLSLAPKVITALWEGSTKTYVFEMDCDEEDYYICCAAIIKIYNVVFKEKSVFVFKFKDAFAVGSLRSYENETENNFCVSALIHATDVPKYANFLDELPYTELDEIPPLIISGSPQEEAITPSKYYRGQAVDSNYLSFLDEVEVFYGASTQKEKNRYLSTDNEQRQQIETYKETCKRLGSIAADDGITSLEVLEEAEHMESHAAHIFKTNGTTDNHESSKKLYPDEFVDADKLLKEILNRRF